MLLFYFHFFFFFFQAEDGIRDYKVTGVQTCALPISLRRRAGLLDELRGRGAAAGRDDPALEALFLRSEEHTSELQSPCNLVCRLLLEKKKKNKSLLILQIVYTQPAQRAVTRSLCTEQ